MYDRTTVQGTTFHAWSTVPRARQRHGFVVSVLGSESDNPGSGPGRGKALCPWDVREKKSELRF